MIKDKITPELKSRFKISIDSTKKTGKEEGFNMCRDKYGKLYPGKTCRGKDCEVTIPLARSCPKNTTIQGDFHTHTSMKLREAIKEDIGREPTTDKVKIIESILMEKRHEKIKIKGIISITTPTYTDVLKALSLKCDGDTHGTTCIGYDLEDNEVECWTAKETITDEQCKRTSKEFDKRYRREKLGKEVGQAVEKWIMDLFDKEIIDLKKDL